MTHHSLAAIGPLVVSTRNPRYFAVRGAAGVERPVYLTGSHIWNNLHDGMGPGPSCKAEPEVFDWDGYLAFLAERGHSFIRLWRWEQVRSQAAGGSYHLCMTPQPWARVGPGTAKDRRPCFDLEQWNEGYFSRLRERVLQAGMAGIYVGVMLFDGWALHLSPPPDHIEGHPFHAGNNVNGIAAESIDDLQVLPLDPRIRALQEAYVRKVVDTLHDLPNVLWEVANESTGDGTVDAEFAGFLGFSEPPAWGDSTSWQHWIIDLVKDHESSSGYDAHPIGMTMQFPVADQVRVNEPLLRSRADWISPGYDDERFANGGHPMAPGSAPSRWYADPPPADGAKVVVSDTDHYAPGEGDALWAWKSFIRGHHPILMDFGLIDGLAPTGSAPSTEPGAPRSFEYYEPARFAMGDTRRYADRVDLLAMEPRTDLASTGYVLADPGREYLVLQPASGQPFTVSATTGRYAVEWWDVAARRRVAAEPVTVNGSPLRAIAPFASPSPAVLYLRALPA